jgi:hypothetical protein
VTAIREGTDGDLEGIMSELEKKVYKISIGLNEVKKLSNTVINILQLDSDSLHSLQMMIFAVY